MAGTMHDALADVATKLESLKVRRGGTGRGSWMEVGQVTSAATAFELERHCSPRNTSSP